MTASERKTGGVLSLPCMEFTVSPCSGLTGPRLDGEVARRGLQSPADRRVPELDRGRRALVQNG
jgi:hypothetical protein